MKPGRVVFVAACASAITAAVFACTAGDPINYTTPPDGSGTPSGDASPVGDGGGPDVAGFPDGESITLTPSTFAKCGPSEIVDGGDCDPTAGEGCCFKRNTSDEAGVCLQEWQVFLDGGQIEGGGQCSGTDFVFQTCISDAPDQPCCWGKGPAGEVFTRYAADCKGFPRACDPTVTADGSPEKEIGCNGGPCTPKTCNGKLVYYCGPTLDCQP